MKKDMSRVQSGAIILGIGVALNLVSRVIPRPTSGPPDLFGAGFVALLALVSVVMVLFGLFRIIHGAITKT
jgi:hypothetical protein